MSKYTLNVQTYSTIKKYSTADETTLFKNKLDALGNTNVTVTNTGVVSSGKSSLFNSLLNKSEEDGFSVGAARTTVAKASEFFMPGIELVDTPGIDVKDQDDEIALKAICSSSIIVMVHNIKMGMLYQNEVDWLKRIKKSFNSLEEIKDRFIFVNTWIDQRMQETSFDSTVKETKRILFETMGTSDIDCYNVSSEFYKKAQNTGKTKFSEISGILTLKSAIQEKAKLYNAKYGELKKKSEINDLVLKNIKTLSNYKKEKTDKKLDIIQDIDKTYNKKISQWETIYNRYKSEFDNYTSIN